MQAGVILDNAIVVAVVAIVLAFVAFQAADSGDARSRCLERFSQTTCDHVLGR